MRLKVAGSLVPFFLAALVCVVSAPDLARAQKDAPKADDAAAKEKDRLRGSWVVVRGVAHGGSTDQPNNLRSMVYITNDRDFGDKFVLHLAEGGDKVRHHAYTFKLDSTKSPKSIDLTFGHTFPGIYELDGDTLKICAGLMHRPAEFKHKAGETSMWLLLHRQR